VVVISPQKGLLPRPTVCVHDRSLAPRCIVDMLMCVSC
jgi:hypothetical protein